MVQNNGLSLNEAFVSDPNTVAKEQKPKTRREWHEYYRDRGHTNFHLTGLAELEAAGASIEEKLQFLNKSSKQYEEIGGCVHCFEKIKELEAERDDKQVQEYLKRRREREAAAAIGGETFKA